MDVLNAENDAVEAFESEYFHYHQEIARSAFADMLHDTERNQKYCQALKKAIDKLHAKNLKANVLDIGAGTGLLSMMAVQCKADSVTACEAFSPMADGAERIIEQNGMRDRIRLIKKRSTSIKVGTGKDDLWQRGNILVTEVFDTELIGEGAIETFNHAHEHLLEKDCIVVPDSGVMYVQVVESPLAWAWNTPKTVANLDGEVLLKTPLEILECKGSCELHDVQLNQFPVDQFRSIVDPVAVFDFDWSGKAPIPTNEERKLKVSVNNTGTAQVLFMWWILKMDQEGDIRVSCAPHWAHEDFAQLTKENKRNIPKHNVIPWRDHWMQAIFYLPKDMHVQNGDNILLHCYHDEFSLWFDLTSNTEQALMIHAERSLCECGFHGAFSRRRIGEINDNQRTKKWMKLLENEIDQNSSVLFISDGSLTGLAIAALKAEHVYYVETNAYSERVLQSYIEYNNLKNVEVVNSVDSNKISWNRITHVLGEPNFNTAILPWDNFKFGEIVSSIRDRLGDEVKIFPRKARIMGVCVDFLDLQKICAPFGICESFDLRLFDKIIEKASELADQKVEPQPLWEYPNKALGRPEQLFEAHFINFPSVASNKAQLSLEIPGTCNGITLWTEYSFSDSFGPSSISTGPTSQVELNKFVNWSMHTRQGVRLFAKPITVAAGSNDALEVTVEYSKSHFNFKFDRQ